MLKKLTFLATIPGKKPPVEVVSNLSEISQLTHFHQAYHDSITLETGRRI